MAPWALKTAVQALESSLGTTGTPRKFMRCVSSQMACSLALNPRSLETTDISAITSFWQYNISCVRSSGSLLKLPFLSGLHSFCINFAPMLSFLCAASIKIAASSKDCGTLLAAAMAMESTTWVSFNSGQPYLGTQTQFQIAYSNMAFQACIFPPSRTWFNNFCKSTPSVDFPE